MAKVQEFIMESSDRVAWTQTLIQGCKTGFDAYKHRQSGLSKETPETDHYYEKSHGCK